MKRLSYLFLFFLLFVAGGFVACEEVEEEGKYANWQERNEAYIDSIKVVANERYITTLEQVKTVMVGDMFILQNPLISTDKIPQYIYCKKLVANPEGKRPLWTETVTTYYYGTLITGEKFDGTFDGYGALDQNILNPPARVPSPYSWTANFGIDEPSLRTGWKTFLQYMHTGERWLVFLPSDSAYGAEGSGAIPGHSVLIFDVILKDIIE